MKRLSVLILVFSIAFTVFFTLPPFLNRQFGPYPLMNTADFFDLFTPFVLILLYWLLFRLQEESTPSLNENLVFLLFAVFWVSGQMMHLTANSIEHLLKGMENSNVYNLTNFYDEVLGHYLWHFGVIGFSALLVYRQWHNPFSEARALTWALVLAGVLYGFTYFAIIIEGATTPLGVPFSVLMVVFGLVRGRKELMTQPVLFFFFAAHIFATILFLVWGIVWGGLPEFSEVGII